MAQDRAYAPYAPKKSVMAVISRYRDRGLPDPLTNTALDQIGISAVMAPRTMTALKFLGLIDAEGRRTETFERLKRATSEDYQGLLAEVIRAAYLPVFTIVNPTEDDSIAVADAFRQYEPSAQRDKMLTLFRGLCEEAGIMKPQGRALRGTTKSRQETPPRRVARSAVIEARPLSEKPQGSDSQVVASTGIDYQVISAIIQQLPRDAMWTSERRERWLRAMTAAIDLIVEIVEQPKEPLSLPSGNHDGLWSGAVIEDE